MQKMNVLTAAFAFGLLLTLQSGCADTRAAVQPSTQPESTMLSQPATTPATSPEAIQQSAAEPAKQAPSLTGKVIETMDASGYTYVNMENAGKTFWVALPVTKVKVGEEIEVWSGTPMGKFTSKTLRKNFDEIIFSPGLVSGTKTKLPAGHAPIDAVPKADPSQPAKAASPQHKGNGMNAQPGPGMTAISGSVVETMDSGGYTYVNLEADGKKAWAAIPVTPVTIGQKLTLQPGMKMDNFTSKSMNRTFDSVIFSGGIIPAPEK